MVTKSEIYTRYLKRTTDIWKQHPKSEKAQNNTRNQEKTPEMLKKHLLFERDTQNLKKTPEIWKGHPKSEKEFYLASMFSTENSLEILFSPKSEKDAQNLKMTHEIWKGHPKSGKTVV